MSSDTQPVLTLAPAQNLRDSASQLQVQPLGPNDVRYVDLGAGRATKELSKLEIFLRNAAGVESAYAKCAFVGGRGSGKSTFLLHLESQLQTEGLFTPIHIYLDPSLESDCDYSDLFLWMVDEIVRQFKDAGHPVDDGPLSQVTQWFAETTLTGLTDWKKEIELTAEAEASAGAGILSSILSIKLLARLKSMIVGSESTRKEIRRKVQNYSTELCRRVNDFLDHAREVLKRAGKPDRLLIVQDNLDRIRDRERAQRLFDQGGDMLLELRADLIYTSPLALHVAPLDITRTFPHVFLMPNVKVRLRNGKIHKPGIDAFVDLASRRLAIDSVFESEKVVRHLAEMSGGSLRDLIRLMDEAQLEAQVDGKQKVDMASAKAAVRKVALSFSRLLVPGSVYFPILAEVHRTKQEFVVPDGEPTLKSVSAARDFFAELIGNGTVLEYNGDDSWYDVHPAVRDTRPFKDASAPQSPTPVQA
ncbi:MAG: hypothetical protein H7A55_23425 [Verrucomicrobiaceae bacterium]|nr:hypothetical protein [Verrucomicrobiaceae bacterium]